MKSKICLKSGFENARQFPIKKQNLISQLIKNIIQQGARLKKNNTRGVDRLDNDDLSLRR